MRPLLKTNAATPAGSTSPVHSADSSARQFADSWLGSMIKLRAKQAEKHAYNLRANLKSKKGFHVQIPKRMLFYTILIFLVLPLILFMYKENHIHDHDPAYHGSEFDLANHSLPYHNSPDHPNTRGGPHKKHGGGNGKHNSLQQLLGSGSTATKNNTGLSHDPRRKSATSKQDQNSNSKPNSGDGPPSNSLVGGHTATAESPNMFETQPKLSGESRSKEIDVSPETQSTRTNYSSVTSLASQQTQPAASVENYSPESSNAVENSEIASDFAQNRIPEVKSTNTTHPLSSNTTLPAKTAGFNFEERHRHRRRRLASNTTRIAR